MREQCDHVIVQLAYLVVVNDDGVRRLFVSVHEGIVDVGVGRQLHHSGLDRRGKNIGRTMRGKMEHTPSLDSNGCITHLTCTW